MPRTAPSLSLNEGTAVVAAALAAASERGSNIAVAVSGLQGLDDRGIPSIKWLLSRGCATWRRVFGLWNAFSGQLPPIGGGGSHCF